VLCLLGSDRKLGFARTLEEVVRKPGKEKSLRKKVKGRIVGLFCGGTLCAEAQIVLADHGVPARACKLIDLGDDQYTRGRPHPMIEPELRNEHLEKALRDKNVGIVLLDVVIGYGAHADPAGLVAEILNGFDAKPLVIASVTGTENDPQVYSKQVATLRKAGVLVADSNAAAARLAARAVGGRR
jgi:FdrA protein